MKISYAITVCNELNEVTTLINFLLDHRRPEDEIVILLKVMAQMKFGPE